MVRASGEALHHAAHAGGIGNRAKSRLPITLDARRLGGEATEWLGAGSARSQRQSADTKEDRDGDTHRCDLVKLGEWSAEDGDMTTPGEQHMHTLSAQRRGRLDSIRASPHARQVHVQAASVIRWPQPITEYIGFIGSLLPAGAIGFRYVVMPGALARGAPASADATRRLVYSETARRAAMIGLIGVA